MRSTIAVLLSFAVPLKGAVVARSTTNTHRRLGPFIETESASATWITLGSARLASPGTWERERITNTVVAVGGCFARWLLLR